MGEVSECVEELAGCIFVQNVEAPAVSILTPVLVLGLKNRSEHVKRRCCVIVDNMCKLIDDHRDASPLLAEVHHLTRKATETIADPDAREMSEKALAAIDKMANAGTYIEQDIKAFATKFGVSLDGFNDAQVEYVSKVAFQLMKNKKPADAKAAFAPLNLDGVACESMLDSMVNAGVVEETEFIDDDADSPDLYKGSFSLAYGTVTLLRDTKLHLKKNKFYGLLGPTNCGKTTMMRAISVEKVEGFPKRSELVTIFVGHDIKEVEKHLDKTPVEYIMWRFAGADDRESLENASMDTTDDDGKKREQPWYICPKTFDLKKCDMTDTKEGKKTRDDAVVPDAIINRQKNTKTKK